MSLDDHLSPIALRDAPGTDLSQDVRPSADCVDRLDEQMIVGICDTDWTSNEAVIALLNLLGGAFDEMMNSHGPIRK